MARFLYFFAFLLLVTPALNGCGERSENGRSPAIRIAGSTSMMYVSEKLARVYEGKHPGVKIHIEGGDSTLGIKGVTRGIVDIASVSRPLTAEETKVLKTYKISEDSVSVIVNDKNPVRELTVRQLREVFTGKITNWNQVGGLDMPVTVVTRERGSGTYNVFKDIIMGEEASIDGKALVMTSTGAVLNTVMRDAGAIGYASSNYQTGGVKTVEIRNGEKRAFVLIRPLMYAVQGIPGGLVEDYLAFCTGEEGKRIVEGIQKN